VISLSPAPFTRRRAHVPNESQQNHLLTEPFVNVAGSRNRNKSICTFETCRPHRAMSEFGGIVLQKSKVAAVQISGENLKREEVDDSCSLSRVTDVAYEFNARR
jgi:hypothetical protein